MLPLHLSVEALCEPVPERSREPLAHLLLGAALLVLAPGTRSRRVWLALAASLIDALVLALLHGEVATRRAPSSDALWRISSALYVLGGVVFGAVADSVVAVQRRASPRQTATFARGREPAPTPVPAPSASLAMRYLALLAVFVVSAWRLNSILCRSRFPIGLARSLLVWLTAALIDAFVWRPRDDNDDDATLREHVARHALYLGFGLYAYAHFGAAYASTWLVALATVTSAGALVLVAGGLVQRGRERAKIQ